MLTQEELAGILHAVVTGNADQAAGLIRAADLDDGLRDELAAHLERGGHAADVAAGLGDVLRAGGAPRDLVNECYRASFYASEAPGRLADNALFAHFLANKGGFVLDKWPHYFPIYDRYLSRWRGGAPRVLEIGVYRGGGLDLLRAYLGPGAHLVGLDIDPVAAGVASARHIVELGDQTDVDLLHAVVDRHGPFDIVIDDGGHTMEQQIVTAQALLPLMPAGSVYMVEDTHTSYWREYGGGVGEPGTFAEWVKGLVDQVHGYHWSRDVDLPELTTLIDAVHVHDSITVLDVGPRTPPFSEVVGTWDFLMLDRPLAAIHSELLAARTVAVQDAERAKLSAQTAWKQLESVRGSRSWRVTQPLRRLRSRVAGRR